MSSTRPSRNLIPALALAGLAMAGLAMAPARADGIADFYKGKTVSLVVGSSTGGGYDTMTRAVARFIG
jgi:tripartite-type tricarboxylate transporter receptor subunit TctC